MVEITEFTVVITRVDLPDLRKEVWVNGVLAQVLYPPKEGGSW